MTAMMNEPEMTLAVATTMATILGLDHGIDEDAMDAAATKAMGVVFQAEAGDPDAQALVEDAMARLRDAIRTIRTDRARRTVN